MVTTSQQVGDWIEADHGTATRLLAYASAGGSYAERAEQAMRAAALFKRCEAFNEIRQRLASEEHAAQAAEKIAEAERTAAGRRNVANAGFDAATAAAVICQQNAVCAGGLA